MATYPDESRTQRRDGCSARSTLPGTPAIVDAPSGPAMSSCLAFARSTARKAIRRSNYSLILCCISSSVERICMRLYSEFDRVGIPAAECYGAGHSAAWQLEYIRSAPGAPPALVSSLPSLSDASPSTPD